MVEMSPVLHSLKSLPFFSGLEEKVLKKIMSIGRELNFEKGAIIFMENVPLEGLHILKKGLVKIYKLSKEGREQILHIVNEGETFAGAPIFLHQAKYPAFAQALEPSSIVLISRDLLFGLIRKNPDISLKVLESFSNYLNALVSLVDDLSLKDVSRRLARFLLDLAKTKGKPTRRGIVIDTKLTKQDIASQLGTVREVISRTLSRFQAKGLINLQGKFIIITNEAKLASL